METTPIYPDSPVNNSYQLGKEYEDFVSTVLIRLGIIISPSWSKKYQFNVGDTPFNAEIKLDRGCTQYQRFSIEVAEKSNIHVVHWSPSGILANKRDGLYIQGNKKKIFVTWKKCLVEYYKDLIYKNGGTPKGIVIEKYGTIKTFYLPFFDAKRIGRVIDPSELQQIGF